MRKHNCYQPTQSAKIAHSPTQGDRELEDKLLEVIDCSNLAHAAYDYYGAGRDYTGDMSDVLEKTEKQMSNLAKELLPVFHSYRKEWAKGLVGKEDPNENNPDETLYWVATIRNRYRSQILKAIEGGE